MISTRKFVIVAGLIATFVLLSGCTTNPATGKRQFNLLSRDQEISLGTEAKEDLVSGYGGVVPSQPLQAYVTGIGTRLVPHTEGDYADLPWEFTFLDSGVINAFALPGGKVFVSRGLVEKMENEAQLAGVLGHEIGHVTAEHADRQISRQMAIQGLAVAGAIFAGSSDDDWLAASVPVVVGGAGVFALQFGRDEEIEADRLGIRYMSKAGYDPMGQLQVMQILKEAAGGGSQPEFLSTHPLPQTRIDRIRKLLDGDYAYTQNNPDYVLRASEFQSSMLARLRQLPPPAEARTALLADPSLWCAHCRDAAVTSATR